MHLNQEEEPIMPSSSSASSSSVSSSSSKGAVVAGPSPVSSTADAVVVIADADAAVSHVGFALSDISYVLPGSVGGGHLGEAAEAWGARGGCNAFGDRGEVKRLETRPGVGGLLAGTVAAGRRASAFAPSSALQSLGATLGDMSAAHSPAVVHVLARSVAEDASLRTAEDLEGVAAAAAASHSIALVSGTLQEAHDVAVLAHAAAQRARVPVIHALDGDAVASSAGSVRLLRYHELAAVVGSAAATPASPAAAVHAAAESLASLLGVRRAGYEYTGHAFPAAVLVATGAAGAVAASVAAQAAATRGERIGVVRILLLEPMDAKGLRAAIPASATQIAVLSSYPSWKKPAKTAGQGWLYARVSAALAASGSTNAASLLDWRSTVDGAFTPRHAAALLAQLSAPAPPASVTVPDVAAASTSDVPLVLSTSTQAHRRLRVWDVGVDGAAAASTARTSARVVSQSSGASRTAVASSFLHGRFEHGSVTVSTISGGDPATAPADEGVDTILVSHMSLVRAYNVFAPLRAGGSVILNATPTSPPPPPALAGEATEEQAASPSATASLTPETIVASLSAADRRHLASINARVYVVDASALAKAHKLGGFERSVLQAALFVSGGAAEFSHTSPALESAQRAVLPTKVHPSLVRLYAALKSALVEVPVEVAGATENASAPRPLYPSLSLRTVVANATADSSAVDASGGTSVLGVGPTEWAAAKRVSTRASSSSSSSSAAAAASAPNDNAFLATAHKTAALSLAFPDAFDSKRTSAAAAAASDGGHGGEGGIYISTVKVNKRLTPLSYDRNVFHLEFDISGTGLTYQIGSALGVHGENTDNEVDGFLSWYGLDADAIVTVETPAAGPTHPSLNLSQTVRRLIKQDLDLFGRPTKEFYEGLARYATDPKEKEDLSFLGSDAGVDVFAARAEEGCTYEDALRDFPSAHPPIAALLSLVPRIKARHYSIASSMRANPTSVHLLVVEVAWDTPKGKQRHGQCSHYLANVKPGQQVAVSVLPSEMHLPADHAAPVVMAGLGTGMAPFRAFIQERACLKAAGVAVGPMTLYFGSRFRAMEYLYGDELEEYAKQGLLTLRLAFSRDTAAKVYIQHLMVEDSVPLAEALLRKRGHFYLCGPTWPEPDVEAAMIKAFSGAGGLGVDGAGAKIRSMKEAKQYVLEVY